MSGLLGFMALVVSFMAFVCGAHHEETKDMGSARIGMVCIFCAPLLAFFAGRWS